MATFLKDIRRKSASKLLPLPSPSTFSQLMPLSGHPYQKEAEKFKLILSNIAEIRSDVLEYPQTTRDYACISKYSVQEQMGAWSFEHEKLASQINETTHKHLFSWNTQIDFALNIPELHLGIVTDLETQVGDNLFHPLGRSLIIGKRKADVKAEQFELEDQELTDPLDRLRYLRKKRKLKEKREKYEKEKRLISKEDSLDFWEAIIFPLLEAPLEFAFQQYILPPNLRLYDFQKEGIIHLINNDNFLLLTPA
ncbi:MAG TPA: hypothetical protein VGB30_13835 [bacterium]